MTRRMRCAYDRFVYGEPTWSGETPTTGPASAEFVADGRDRHVTVDDSSDVLRRRLALSCGRQRLADVVEISFGQTWTAAPGGQALNYVFPLWFSLDDGPQIHVELKGDTEVQGAMDTLCEP